VLWKLIRRIRGKNWRIVGDSGNTGWMDILQTCHPPFSSWSVLQDGLAIHWIDDDRLVIQGRERVREVVIKGNWQCRTKQAHCAWLTTTGKSCYEIMLEAYDRRAKPRSGGS
jgi:hypothetical protein